MKNLFAIAIAASLVVCALGCGGPSGGPVTENVEQSEVEAYQAEAAAEQKRLEEEAANMAE